MPYPDSNILVLHSCEICGSQSSVAGDSSLRVYDVVEIRVFRVYDVVPLGV